MASPAIVQETKASLFGKQYTPGDAQGLKILTTVHLLERIEQRAKTFEFPQIGNRVSLSYSGVRGWVIFTDWGVLCGMLFPQEDSSFAYLCKTILQRDSYFKNYDPVRIGLPRCWKHFQLAGVGRLSDAATLQLQFAAAIPTEWAEAQKKRHHGKRLS